MAQKALNNQDIHIVIIKMRGKAVPQRMTRYVKLNIQWGISCESTGSALELGQK